MKTAKAHGEGLDWLKGYEMEEDRALRRGEFPSNVLSTDDLKNHKEGRIDRRKRKKKVKDNG